jgi:hypothetical protein
MGYKVFLLYSSTMALPCSKLHENIVHKFLNSRSNNKDNILWALFFSYLKKKKTPKTSFLMLKDKKPHSKVTIDSFSIDYQKKLKFQFFLLISTKWRWQNLKYDVEEKKKKFHLCHHSKKLAIAFGLINTTPSTPLRLRKSCKDCHTSTKFISKIVRRSIVVRDANCFHHFEDGVCSCMDYLSWQ